MITVVQNTLAIFFAVLLNQKLFMADVAKSVFFLPAVLSILVVGYLFQYIMTSADYGLLNNILRSFGGKPVNWLGSNKLALYSVLATQVWQWIGWSMVIYIANLKSTDPGLYEAARMDGAGGLKLFSWITLPLLYPAASFNILMSLIGGLKVFDAVFAMTKGGAGGTGRGGRNRRLRHVRDIFPDRVSPPEAHRFHGCHPGRPGRME